MKTYYTESKDNGACHEITIIHYNSTEVVYVADENLEGFEQCLNALGFIKEYPDDIPKETTPCNYGECPFNAEGGYDCRNYCGLGVDEDEEYIPSAENGDYSPSNPWDAPGMSIKDFI